MVFQYPSVSCLPRPWYRTWRLVRTTLACRRPRLPAALSHRSRAWASTCHGGRQRAFELSGGQQRRVAFAGVLAMEPEVLVLDEPMAGLDPAARSDFLELIDRLHHGGLTVVMVSHSMDDLANCCDRIVVMNEGAVFAEGTPAQVLRMRMSSSRSAWAYLLLSAWRWRSRRRACRCVAAGSIRLSRWPTSWQIC